MNDYYKLLYPIDAPTPKKNLISISDDSFEYILFTLNNNMFAFDFETSSLQVWKDPFWVRSVSFHNENVSVSIEIRDSEGGLIDGKREKYLYSWLVKQPKMIAHNFYFEASVLYRATKKIPHIFTCTRAIFMSLANEGNLHQSWSLDQACCRLLEGEEWDWSLTDGKPEYVYRFHEYLTKNGLKKDTMCKADFQELGWYNQLDSAATWYLYKLFRQVVAEYQDSWGQFFWQYMAEDVQTLIRNEVEAYGEGLTLNLKEYREDETDNSDDLRDYGKQLEREIAINRAEFFKHPKVAKAVDAYRNKMVSEHLTKKPDMIYNKDGITPNGQRVKSIKTWEKRLKELENNDEFNLNSADQLRWLFCEIFDVVEIGNGYEVYEKGCKDLFTKLRKTKGGKKSVGQLQLDEKGLRKSGWFGKLVLDYRKLGSQLTFINTLLENEVNGKVHIAVKVFGTFTSRLSSGAID